MSYDQTNTGTLGKNARKEKETHPDYAGQCNIDGREYWLSAWLKTAGPTSRNPGEKFFSLSFKPKQPAQSQHSSPAPQSRPQPTEKQLANQGNLDEDVPFN